MPVIDHRVHQQNVARAWRAFLTHKYLCLLGPAAVLVGSASVVDAAVGALRTVGDIVRDGTAGIWMEAIAQATAPVIVALAVSLLLIGFLAAIAQGAIVHTLYTHHEHTVAHGIHHALAHGLRHSGRVILLQIAALGFNLLIVTSAATIIVHLHGPTLLWNEITWIVVGGLMMIAVWVVHSVKLISLQWIVGARKPVPESIVQALALIRRHPIIVLEHTLVLFCLFVVGAIGVSIVLLVSATVLVLPLTFLLSVAEQPQFLLATMATIIVWGIGMLALGILCVFNLSMWAQLTHHLYRSRRPMPSRALHTLRTYFPVFKKYV